MEESTNKLTVKQENFCQSYILHGDKSKAYREAYDAENMLPETINRKAFEVFQNGNVSARIKGLLDGVKKRNAVTIDEIVENLASMLRFDIAELYDETGNMKNIHTVPKEARIMIAGIETFEEFQGAGASKEFLGYTKKVKTYDKLGAVEKLMKHLGGYEKDNFQKKAEINVVSSMTTEELVQRAQAIKEINGTA